MGDFQQFLPILKNGNLSELNLCNFIKSFKKNEVKFAENLQYAIYHCCVNDLKGEHYESVQKLVGVCYSDSAIHGLKNVPRFVGCIAAICVYFFKCGKTEDTLLLINVLKEKEKELRLASTSHEVRSNLFVLHHHFLETAIKQADTGSHSDRLLNASLKPLLYIDSHDLKISQKLVRNIKHAIHTIGTEDTNKFNTILKITKSILNKISTSEEFKSSFEIYFSTRIICFINTKNLNKNPEILNLKCKNEIKILLNLMNLKLEDDWNNVIDYFTIAGSSLDKCVASTNFIIQNCRENDRKLSSLIISNFFTTSLWNNVQGCNFTVEDVKQLYSKFVKYLWTSTIGFRSYAVGSSDSDNNRFSLLRSLGQCWIILTFLCRTTFKKRLPSWLDLIPIALDAFNSCCMCLDKNHNANLYLDVLVPIANSVEDILSMVNDSGEWSVLEDFCKKVINTMVLSKQPLPIEKERFNLVFSRWYLACRQQGKHEEGMMVCAYQICAVDGANYEDQALMSWVTSKLNNTHINNDVIFWEFIVSKSEEIIEFGLDALTLDRKTIVIAEMKAYRTIATSDCEMAVQKLWKYFLTLNATPFETAQVLNHAIAATAHLSNQNNLIQWINETKKIEHAFSCLKNSEKDVKVVCFEGILKYSSFVCLANMSRKHCEPESRNKILNALKTQTEKNIMFGEEGNMNLACDISPAEGLLSLGKEGVNLEALESTLNSWLNIPQLWTPDSLSSEYISLLLEHLHLIANTATLYGAADLTIRAWTLYYRIATLANEKSHQLQAVSALIKECDCEPESAMVLCGLQLAQELENNADIKKLPPATIDALFAFYLSIANIYLNHKNIQKCGEVLLKCVELQKVVRKESVFLMMRGQLVCAISRLLSYAPDCELFPKYQNHHHSAFSALHYVKAALNAATHSSLCSKQQSELVLALLDVSTWAAAVFHALLLTPYVRAFLEDLYTICQSLQFTARTAQILSTLVEVDLNTRNLSDAKLKLSNLISMVSLTPLLPSINEKMPIPDYLDVDVSPLRCVPSKELDLSPICAMLPPMHTDASKATQRPAEVWNRGLLVLVELKTRSNEAVAAAMAGDNATSALYHNHCHSIIKSFNINKYHKQIQHELSNTFPNESLGYLQRDFRFTAGRVLMNFAQFCMLPNSPTSGRELELIKEAEEYISSLSSGKCFLDWTLLELRISNYLSENKKNKQNKPSIDTLDVPKISKCEAKTPLMNRKVVNALAPKRHDVINDAPVTPIIPPKLGRKIFETKGEELGTIELSPAVEETAACESPLTSKEPNKRRKRIINEKSACRSRKMIETPAIASLRASRMPANKLQETVNISSGSSIDFISSPSPVISTTAKKTRRPQAIQAKPTLLVFDESKAETNEDTNTSKDLFDSFEKQLKVSKPKTRKPASKKVLTNPHEKKVKTTRL